MKSESGHLNARDYINSLAAGGRHHFSSGEAQAALGVSAAAARLALNRLARQKLVSPGFTWDIDEATLVVSSRVIEILHGDPWKSEG